jgi:hypothetical protein
MLSLCAICHAAAVLDVSVNLFGNGVSPGFGNCSRLPVLSAGRNNLASELIPGDLFDVRQYVVAASAPVERDTGRLDCLQIARLINLVRLAGTWTSGAAGTLLRYSLRLAR